MKLIVGLGNPGEKYERTRHNVGIMVVEKLLKDLASLDKSIWKKDEKAKAEIAKIGDNILVKPQTFMNASGFAVAKLVNFYKIPPGSLWVIHDDLDLPLGKIKIRRGGGTAGHHGLESIIEKLGTDDFIRFRLGIGRPFKEETGKVKGRRSFEKVDEYVLSPFLPGETHIYKELVKKAVKAIRLALEKDIESAMNHFNAK